MSKLVHRFLEHGAHLDGTPEGSSRYVTKIVLGCHADDNRIFVADPAAGSRGSRHNRGCVVDLSLYDLKTGKEVKMPRDCDEMTDRASSGYAGGTPEESARGALLRRVMEKRDFQVKPRKGWWLNAAWHRSISAASSD